ncbi:MAG: ArnT family glycosyltransferase [Acidimicrobiales bacterium]
MASSAESAATESPAGSRRPYVIAVLALSCVAAVASYVVYRKLFPLGSGDLDEGVYVFQANMLLHGLVSLPAHRYGEFFRPWLTGQRDGRIFTEFQLGLPAYLAGSQLIFGSMRVGLALLAGLTVLATYGFAYELVRERRVAITASAFLVLSPIFLVHSALVLTYTLSLFGLTAAGWGVLRGCRTGRRRDLLVGGLALGVALLTRPFDVLLFGLPLLVFALYRLHRLPPSQGEGGWGPLATLAAPILAGLAPFVAATLWYNWQATGSPLAFPNMTADPLNTFGFGTRRLMIGQSTHRYDFVDALSALKSNAVTIPSWIFGGPVMLGLAAFGLYKLRKSADGALLVVIALAFPLGYLFWWATALSGVGAENGLGPQYYVPSFVALVILAAVGLTRLVERRGWPFAVAGFALLVAVTGYAVPPKISANLRVTRSFQHEQSLIPRGVTDALIFVHPSTAYNGYLLGEYPFLETSPDLQGRIVFAIDRGASDSTLMREMASRATYMLRQYEPGNRLLSPEGSLFAVRTVHADQIVVSIRPLEVLSGEYARAYISNGVRTWYVVLHPGADGKYPATAWFVAPESAARGAADAISVPAAGELTVGVETSSTAAFARPTKQASRFSYLTSNGALTVLTPGLGWSYRQYPGHGIWVPSGVSSEIKVVLTPG